LHLHDMGVRSRPSTAIGPEGVQFWKERAHPGIPAEWRRPRQGGIISHVELTGSRSTDKKIDVRAPGPPDDGRVRVFVVQAGLDDSSVASPPGRPSGIHDQFTYQPVPLSMMPQDPSTQVAAHFVELPRRAWDANPPRGRGKDSIPNACRSWTHSTDGEGRRRQVHGNLVEGVKVPTGRLVPRLPRKALGVIEPRAHSSEEAPSISHFKPLFPTSIHKA